MAQKPKKNYSTKAGAINPKDVFGSPSYSLNPVLPHLPKHWTLWESCAGEGLMVNALEINGYTVIATELSSGTDYFAYEPESYNCQVTNPPFSRKYDWLDRAYQLGKPFALLMPGDTLFAGSAIRLFQKFGVEVIVPSRRIDFKTPLKGWDSNAQMSTLWFTWQLEIGNSLNFFTLVKPKKTKSIQAHIIQHPEQLDLPRDQYVMTALF